MFREAYAKAVHFTAPVIYFCKTFDGKLEAGLGVHVETILGALNELGIRHSVTDS